MTQKEKIEIKLEIINDLLNSLYNIDSGKDLHKLLDTQAFQYESQLNLLKKYNVSSFEEAEKKLEEEA